MRVACSQCQNQLQIDDAKVPAGAFKIKCPKCGNVNTVQAPAASDASGPEDSEQAISPEIEAFVKREIAVAKKEILGAIQALFGGEVKWHTEEGGGSAAIDTGKKALICEDDQVFVDIVSATVRKLGYSIDVARSTSEAIKKVENGYYQLITVDYIFPDDKEGGNKIIAKINGQKPAQRRQTFVVLISANVKSADANAAFFHGANITVNKEEIKNLESLIREGQRHFQQIYSIFNRVLADKNERI